MPKTIFLGPEDCTREGISITWTPSAKRIDISAWYDSMVGIQGESLTLREFYDRLGITEKDCVKAWDEQPCNPGAQEDAR